METELNLFSPAAQSAVCFMYRQTIHQYTKVSRSNQAASSNYRRPPDRFRRAYYVEEATFQGNNREPVTYLEAALGQDSASLSRFFFQAL
jgi:hypothetical protein